MREPRAARTAAIAAVAAATISLAGCIPGPPPVPQPTPAAPVVQGEDAASEVRQGRIGPDSTAVVELEVEERSAVVIGASSPDEEDLTLRLTGGSLELEVDDSYGDPDGFAFELDSRDPVLAAVLEPGAYAIEVAEYGGDSSRFELQVLLSAATVAPGERSTVTFAPGAPAVAIVPAGSLAIAATAPEDTVLWARAADADESFDDDDSGGDRNPRIELGSLASEDLVVVLTGYSRESSGSAQLSVE